MQKLKENLASLVPKEKTADQIKEEEKHDQIKLLLTDDVYQKLKQYEFIKLMQNPEILEKVAYKIYERDPSKIHDYTHFKQALKHTDKNMFMKFRESIITYD